ncbi:glycosyl hydrolase [Pseudoruegeria sp. HB172150]|uniref:glycosyl hydrolase n=1 Tax=Pseudoruegeria sp. HB172150 TaxID=2721164 RepID=UPI001551D630|nr:glycosyl hydrolase [Pseudoruegeria sp. HB172150]
MYASHGFLRSDIGDVDVVYHDGIYHLFHLVLPNHDFIAHAVSRDGMTWRRVKNALFVDDPGAWDDDMLWTMHVTRDPDDDASWRMFYTGLSRTEYGRVQRIGVARSKDLYNWTRCNSGKYPLEISPEWYEANADEGRNWVSFRDPFFYHDRETGERLLLAAGRVKDGPIVRRGCVSLAREVETDRWEFGPPLYKPGLYDDVEVPNLFWLNGRYYLIGSIREDVKIHYWTSDELTGPFRNFADNVLLPKGNYAARICRAGDKLLLFNFFQRKEVIYGRETIARMLPPPKELVTDTRGRLMLKSFSQFDKIVRNPFKVTNPAEIETLLGNPHATISNEGGALHVGCLSGYEAFLLPGEHQDFRLRAKMSMEGIGKCGLVFRMSDEADGYYLALDLVKGYAQLRRWGANPRPEFEFAFQYESLQSGNFVPYPASKDLNLEIVTHGMYIEFSINGQVTLCVVDDAYDEGRVGFYTESAQLRLEDVTMEWLSRPITEEEPVYTATRSHHDLPAHPLETPLGE